MHQNVTESSGLLKANVIVWFLPGVFENCNADKILPTSETIRNKNIIRATVYNHKRSNDSVIGFCSIS